MTPLERLHQTSLIGMLVASYLAIASAQVLDLPSLVLAGAALLVRVLLCWPRLGIPLLPDVVATAGAFLYLGFYPIDYYLISRDFLSATVHLVLFLTALLVLRARTWRDYALLEVVAFLQILAGAALSQSGLFALFVGVFFLCGILTATCREILGHSTERSTKSLGLATRVGWLAMTQFVAMLLLGAGFFFFLPRTARAAMEHWMPERFHVSGFSSSVTLGQIGEIRMSTTPVMHARLYNPVPARDLKWRGATLALFDGNRWYNPPGRTASTLKIENHLAPLTVSPLLRPGRRVFYDVQASPSASDVLFFLGTPELVQIDARELERMPGNAFRLTEPVEQLRYGARSVIPERVLGSDGGPLPALAAPDQQMYLQLPRLDARVVALANDIAPGAEPAVKAEAIETYLSTKLQYTTELPTKVPADPVANFLFERKKGHCEYFASAMALMLRSQGIPSRIVTGYQSGVFNPMTQWYLIRASDAHSWVEAYLPGYGWRPFDPTPSASADAGQGIVGRLGLYADAMEVFWQEWIVGYDQERQLALAGRLSRSRRWPSFQWEPWEARLENWWKKIDWRQLTVILAAFAGMVLAVFSVPNLLRRWHSRQQKQRALSNAAPSDATLLYLQMTKVLARRGFERPPWMTPAEFAATDAVRQQAPLVARVTEAYNDMRFGKQSGSAGELVDALSQLELELKR